jgi:hypothetical protein
MKTSLRRIGSMILLFASLFLLAASFAKADAYQIYSLGDGHRRSPIGITASGEVVILDTANLLQCGAIPFQSGCYQLYMNGVLIGAQIDPPSLVYDDGTPCTPVSQFPGDIAAAKCNGSHEVYGTDRYAAIPRTIFDGPNLTDTVASGYELDELLLNSSGDFAFVANEGFQGIDGDGEIYEAVDLTTDAAPESASFLLVGTGVLAALGSLRRRVLLAK